MARSGTLTAGCSDPLLPSPWRLYVELSGEDGAGPVLAVDRASRHHAVAQARTKNEATRRAADALTELLDG